MSRKKVARPFPAAVNCGSGLQSGFTLNFQALGNTQVSVNVAEKFLCILELISNKKCLLENFRKMLSFRVI